MSDRPASLAECRILIATPVYGGAQAEYMSAAIELSREAARRGVALEFSFVSNEPSINRARNSLAHHFKVSSATHLVFVDCDIGFHPEELLKMVEETLASDDNAIVGAPYPKRGQNWATIAQAADAGFATEDPRLLEQFGGDFAFELADPVSGVRLDALAELKYLGTAMMVIRRDVIEALCEKHPELAYTAAVKDTALAGTKQRIHALFQPIIDPETQHLLSDDYAFCLRVRQAGFRVWLAPWVRTTHTGPAVFSGALADLAALQARTQALAQSSAEPQENG